MAVMVSKSMVMAWSVLKSDNRIIKCKEVKALLEIINTLPSEKRLVLVAEYPLKKHGLNNYQPAKECQ